MNKITFVFISVLVFISSLLKAQDHHLSNFDVAGLYLNPAVTGMDKDADYHVTIDQRSQWRSLGIKPFLSSYLAYDMPYSIGNRDIGLGAYIINNNAGPGNFNTFSFLLSASYDLLAKPAGSRARPKLGSRMLSVPEPGRGRQKHTLRVGLQAGLFYRSSNGAPLSYDSQYSLSHNGGSFDQALPSNEENARMNIGRFDVNYGIYYKYVKSAKSVRPFAGFSMAHITRPNESLNGGMTRMPVAFKYYGGCEFQLDTKTELVPRFLYIKQAMAQAVTSGFLLHYQVGNELRVTGGFDYRWKDACILSFGLKQGSYGLRMAYDINTSYLKNYSNGRGAFEMALMYSKKKERPRLIELL